MKTLCFHIVKTEAFVLSHSQEWSFCAFICTLVKLSYVLNASEICDDSRSVYSFSKGIDIEIKVTLFCNMDNIDFEC